MSVLTKVFVVLVTLLAIVLSALATVNVANQRNYRTEIDSLNTEVKSARSQAQSREMDLLMVQNDLAARIARMQNEVTNKDGRIRDLEGTVARRESELVAAEANKNKLAADLARLTATNQVSAEMLKAANDELVERRRISVDLQTKNAELVHSINELQAQSDGLDRLRRRLEEQLTDARQEVARLTAAAAASGVALTPRDGGTEKPLPPEVVLRGSITRVEKVGEQTFVQVDIGANDGVREGMQFLVHSGDRFLANLTINKVDERSASGTLSLIQGEVAEGTRVLAGPRSGV